MNLRIVGTTKLRKDAVCPYCKKIAKHAGGNVEIIVDTDTSKQFAHFPCPHCKEQLMLPG
jgi:uncharacterized protein with PIN domain